MNAASPATHPEKEVQFNLQDINVHFGLQQALHNINLQIAKGDRLALIGANGSGKSTLLRVLHGLITSTRVKATGRLTGTIKTMPGTRQAMLFQRPHMLRMSVLNNVTLAAWLNGQSWQAGKKQAMNELKRVGLLDLSQRPANTLSQGQQQRVAFARASVTQPNVLVLDEPTASMDPRSKREVEGLMQDFAEQDSGLTLIFASHNLGQVKRLATHVAYLEYGKILAFLPVAEFFDEDHLTMVSQQAQKFLKGNLL
ncbi:MAG: ATP-binding cassette domain-containing protein [Polaromonas sp.]|jgi:tungstate transport system ATP-binding protein|nr:ATP-binding cassette domain-containing protein [Polaromonas sp.]HOZ65854.1 ATP-binding cassette domain-containing protein [Burkholderiaceae bacterium]MBL0253278.1 ATP-binding cassette domain-containing protein [Polaromonas sp.]MBP6088247.1 ATP-binding cassette domain-containing protein [Polaromonas sp.]MBP6142196.1 ATP-binding cassette domain-containing protein [Polaromonas sp.]